MRIVPKLSPEAIALLKVIRELKKNSESKYSKGLAYSLYAVYTQEPYIDAQTKNLEEGIKCRVELGQGASVDPKLFGPPYLPSPFKLNANLKYQGVIMLKKTNEIHKYLRSQCFKDMLDNVFILPKIEDKLKGLGTHLVKLFTSNVLEAGSRKFYTNNDEKLVEVKHASDIDISSLLSFRKLVIIDDLANKSSIQEVEKTGYSYVAKDRDEAASIVSSYLLEDHVYVLFNPFDGIIDKPHVALEYANEIALLLRHVYHRVSDEFWFDYFRISTYDPKPKEKKLLGKFIDLLTEIKIPPLIGKLELDEDDVQAYFYYIEHFKKNKEIVSPQIILFE